MQLVRTHQSKPSAAPIIKEAKMVNVSTILISWSEIEDKHHNGPLIGYQVRYIQYEHTVAHTFSDLELTAYNFNWLELLRQTYILVLRNLLIELLKRVVLPHSFILTSRRHARKHSLFYSIELKKFFRSENNVWEGFVTEILVRKFNWTYQSRIMKPGVYLIDIS